MKTVGIDIGAYSIKFAELESSGSSVTINALQEHPLSQNPGTDKELELITILKDALAQYDKENTSFVLGLPQDRISTRSLFFPFKEKFKILKSLPFELEDLIPFASQDAIFEGKITKLLPHGSEVLAVAAPKELVKSYLDLSSDVQIDPQIISLEGFALNNLFEDVFLAPPVSEVSNDDMWADDTQSESEGFDSSKNIIPENTNLEPGEAILDIGHSSSILIVRSQGSLKNIRRINWGAVNLARAVAKQLNIQEVTALQQIKASKGIILNKKYGSESDIKFSDLMSDEISKLGRALKLTLLEIKGANSVDIKGMGLLGGLAQLPNIGPKLTEFTFVACNKISKLKNHPELNIAENSQNEISMGVAIGLALESFRRAKNPAINFRKEEFAKANSSFIKFWDSWGFYVNLAAASFVVFFAYSTTRSMITADLASQASRSMKAAAVDVFKMKRHTATEAKLSKIFKALDKRELTKVKISELTKRSANAPLVSLRKITEKASSKSRLPMDISQLKINKKLIEISGSTTSKSELRKFSKKLKGLALGNSVKKTERPQKNGSVDFTITFKPRSNQ